MLEAILVMGLLSFLRESRQRWVKLRQIGHALASPGVDAMSFIKGASDRNTAEIQLLDLVESDRTLHGIMQKHGATRADLQNIYTMLLRCGAGQWSRGHWVAASALCYGSTLEFVLTKLREGEVARGTPREIWLPVAFRLVEYFGKGKVGRL
jgi:hypothetical protein